METANLVLTAQRRGRISSEHRHRAQTVLNGLNVRVDEETSASAWSDAYDLALAHKLSIYDALYLELARRLSAPLATFDKRLASAASSAGIALAQA